MNEKELLIKCNSLLKRGTAKLLAVSGIAIFVFISVSMLSYDIADIPEIVHPYNVEPVNFFGKTGAESAFLVINYLGISVLLMLLSTIYLSSYFLLSPKPEKIILR
ncbi:MAG: DNA translocase FtsK 4TM domain-containing protein, partial [Planctomycetes bacterium]|nr:DNA translocase FtsK 4TM domain-containing protein [Planctomycetota bacterium]